MMLPYRVMRAGVIVTALAHNSRVSKVNEQRMWRLGANERASRTGPEESIRLPVFSKVRPRQLEALAVGHMIREAQISGGKAILGAGTRRVR